MAAPQPLARVPYVYGGYLHVAKADLEDARKVMLPLYTRKGLLWRDTPAGERARRRGEATSLHRENIAQENP